MPKGMGFAAAQSEIAKKKNPKTGKPYGKDIAAAILAKNARRASAAAKKANPNLNKVRQAKSPAPKPSSGSRGKGNVVVGRPVRRGPVVKMGK